MKKLKVPQSPINLVLLDLSQIIYMYEYFKMKSACFSSICRNVETRFNTMRVVVKFMNAKQCEEIRSDMEDLLRFIESELAFALKQPAHCNRKYKAYYHSANFHSLLSSLCTTRDKVVDQLVSLGLETQIGVALNSDLDRVKADNSFKQDLYNPLNSLWSILLPGGG